MDAQRFLAEFGHIANAPGGIGKLRELILELAIRGELVATSDRATNAETLLSEIDGFRKELVSAGKLRRPTPQPEIEDSELPFKLPENWAFERLGDVCEIVRGVTFQSSKKQTNRSSGVVACLRTSNVQAEIDWNDLIFIEPELVGRADQWVEKGDTMISMANSYELVGKVALVREVKERATFGGFIAAVRPHVLEPDYLYLVLRSPYMQARMRVTASQTTNIANISLGGMRPIPTPIPPKEEQSRIVAKVDELMALCDKLEAQQQARRKLQNNLRKSTLQAVASATSPHELQTTWARLADNFGRLFHAQEDLIDLDQCIKHLALKGLLSVRAEGEMVNSEVAELTRTSTAAVPDSEMDWSIPDHWVWARCAWLGEARLGKMLDAAKNKGDFRPYLRNINVRWGRFDLSDVLQMRIEEHELSKVSVRKGDLVICEGGEPGRAAVWSGEEEFVIQKALHRFRCNEDVLPEYILFCLEHDYFSGRLSRYFTGATIKHLTGRALAEYPIPLPPVDEQKRILVAANELMHSAATLKERLIAGNRCAAALAAASVASLTGIAIKQEEEPMKAPQTELIAPLRLGTAPDIKAQAPLATILARHHGGMSAKDLWQRFGGEIDAFYAQLKTEVAHGWIEEPAGAEMRVSFAEAVEG